MAESIVYLTLMELVISYLSSLVKQIIPICCVHNDAFVITDIEILHVNAIFNVLKMNDQLFQDTLILIFVKHFPNNELSVCM